MLELRLSFIVMKAAVFFLIFLGREPEIMHFELFYCVLLKFCVSAVTGSEEILAPTPMTNLEFGATHVVRPKGKHQATIVWLHGMGDKGLR